jgi:threonine synthase
MHNAPNMMNPNLLGFRCTLCRTEYAINKATYTCPACGGNLDALYDYERIAHEVNPADIVNDRDRSVWHYSPLLPVQKGKVAGHFESTRHLTPQWSFGFSPLYRAPLIEQHLHINAIWLKDDGRLPSSSFKDRASSMVIARAMELGVTAITTASTGNAASALATLCAGTGITAHIFVPEGTPEGKLAMMLIHGAQVYAVRGSYDDAVAMSNQAAQRFGWYNRNTGLNPYTREGKKTAAFEVCEQLAAVRDEGREKGNTHPTSLIPHPSFRAPSVMLVPVGDGNIISGIHKGFRDLLALGWIERMPRLIGITASLAPALFRAWQSGGEHIQRQPSTTIASGISVDVPNDGIMALRAVRETGGIFIEATDEEMLAAMATLAQQAGVFVEPACAAAYVGLEKARALGAINADDEVVLQLTGSGLKDTKSAMQAAGKPKVALSLDDLS